MARVHVNEVLRRVDCVVGQLWVQESGMGMDEEANPFPEEYLEIRRRLRKELRRWVKRESTDSLLASCARRVRRLFQYRTRETMNPVSSVRSLGNRVN